MGSNFEISKSGLNYSFGGWQVIAQWVSPDCHTDCSGKCLEYGFYFMMFIFTVTCNVQVAMCCIREGFKEMKKHFSWHIPHFLPLKMCIPDNPVSSAKIQEYLCI